MELFSNFKEAITSIETQFTKEATLIETEKWQGIKLPQPMMELLMVSLGVHMPEYIGLLAEDINPNLPWADIHFNERVAGIPLNPGESYKQWPFYKMDKAMRTEGEQFSHTYMERLWPKHANVLPGTESLGIRYGLGDLNDLIKLLYREPLTRQAFLPIWFPEDTGVLHGGRVPCTIGYHFIVRDNQLHVVYYIRSCDMIRHWRDDMYLAVRKVMWILYKLREIELQKTKDFGLWSNIKPGTFLMHITSLHCFQSDMYLLNKKYGKDRV